MKVSRWLLFLALGCAAVSVGGLLVFRGGVNLAAGTAERVDPILVFNESVDRRLVDLDGGEPSMAVFASYDHTDGSYSRNKNLWCADLGRELTGVAVFKGGGGNHLGIADSYGGVMITRRHILFCNHAHPAYPGSPAPWLNGLGFRIRFVAADDEIIERKLVWGRRVKEQDLWIGVLDEDLPENIESYRIFRNSDGLTIPREKVPEVGFSQGSSRLSPSVSFKKFNQLSQSCETSHYGTVTEVEGENHYQQVPMIYVSNSSDVDCHGEKGSELRARFRYCVWDGDSGTPRFHLFGSELLLARIILSGGGGGVALGDKIEILNETIALIDQEAVSQSRLKTVTGQQVEGVTQEALESVK